MQCSPGLPCQQVTGNTRHLGTWFKTQPAMKLTEKTGIRVFLAMPCQALSGLWCCEWALCAFQPPRDPGLHPGMWLRALPAHCNRSK